MKKTSIKGRIGRGAFFSALTVFIIAVLLVGNVALGYFGQNRLLFADLTPEGLYTLTDGMIDECSVVEDLTEVDENGEAKRVEILFCTDPDNLLASAVTRIPYFMALALDNKFENVTVDTVNVALNPAAVAKFKTTSLTTINPSNIIVSYGSSYRIVKVESLWGADENDTFISYNGEYKMASIIKSLIAIERPTVYFVNNHDEDYYDVTAPESAMSKKLSAFYDLLINRGFLVDTINLEEEEIPDDCVLLIINNPKKDFKTGEQLNDLYDYSETDKLDRYLVRDLGSIMVAKDYAVDLPNLESFMLEWGIEFCDGVVKDETANGGALAGDNSDGTLSTDIVGKYITSTDSHAYGIYGEYASLASAPRFIIPNTGYVKCAYKEGTSKQEDGTFNADRLYSQFFTTSENARAFDENGNPYTYKGVKDLMAIATRTDLDRISGEFTYSYMVAVNSADLLNSDVVGNASYANYDILSAIINNISRADEYASISLGGISENSSSYGGKMLVSTALSDSNTEIYSSDFMEIVKVNFGISQAEIALFTVIAFIAPAVVLVLGIVVRIKRKFL